MYKNVFAEAAFIHSAHYCFNNCKLAEILFPPGRPATWHFSGYWLFKRIPCEEKLQNDGFNSMDLHH